jgi:hypothetical protein
VATLYLSTKLPPFAGRLAANCHLVYAEFRIYRTVELSNILGLVGLDRDFLITLDWTT